MNMKKEYIAPRMKAKALMTEGTILEISLDPTKETQNVTPVEEEYDGEFGAREFVSRSVWDD